MAETVLELGFRDPVIGSQSVFRAILDAMASPGCRKFIPAQIQPPPPLYPGTAAILLALADFETSIWLDPEASNGCAVRDYLQFHTGARVSNDAGHATFAVISASERMPSLSKFAQGSPEYPDRSTTIIVQVETLRPAGWRLSGPGIETMKSLSAEPVPMDFIEQLASNRAAFPCGVDIILVSPSEVVALPRSTRVSREA